MANFMCYSNFHLTTTQRKSVSTVWEIGLGRVLDLRVAIILPTWRASSEWASRRLAVAWRGRRLGLAARPAAPAWRPRHVALLGVPAAHYSDAAQALARLEHKFRYVSVAQQLFHAHLTAATINWNSDTKLGELLLFNLRWKFFATFSHYHL